MEFLKKNAMALTWCVMELVMGILLIIHSESFIKVLAIVVGILMMVLGAAFIIMYFVTHAREAEGKYLFNGLTYITLGIILCVKYGLLYAAIDLLFVVLAVALFIGGFEHVQESCDKIRLRQKGWVPGLIAALIEIVIAILIVAIPESKWLFITLGIIVILDAVYSLVVLIFLGRVSSKVKKAKNVTDIDEEK